MDRRMNLGLQFPSSITLNALAAGGIAVVARDLVLNSLISSTAADEAGRGTWFGSMRDFEGVCGLEVDPELSLRCSPAGFEGCET